MTIRLIILLFMLLACGPKTATVQSQPEPKQPERNLSNQFKKYWFQGLAELNRYELIQNRYGQERRGEAVMVFVTEDFIQSTQVKKERPTTEPVEPVLKLNLMKRFITGMYDYSMMTSVFTSLKTEGPALKITQSVQDWCGQQFSQMNRRNGQMQYQIRSYFQEPADIDKALMSVLSEEDLLLQLRIDPAKIDTGQVQMMVSLEDYRLHHLDLEAQTATIRKSDSSANHQISISYRTIPRTVEIEYQATAPYRIERMRITHRGNTSTLTRTKTMMSPYWNKNRASDESLRSELGVTGFDRQVP